VYRLLPVFDGPGAGGWWRDCLMRPPVTTPAASGAGSAGPA